nr:CHAP domain-containing protein [Lachnospiraceae bacterium]
KKAESKKLQKDKIKRDYAKKAREAQKGAKTAGKKGAKAGKKAAEDTGSAVSAAMQKITEFIAEHPVETILGALVIIILLAFMSTLNSCGMIFGGVSGGSVSATYTAEDADIWGAETDYQAKEAALRTKMNSVESLYPGYDEYRTDYGTIGHNAWHLASVLTVIHQDFTRADVQGSLTNLFDAQYTFTVTSQSETRYRTERRTGYSLVYDYDEDGVAIGSHYVPYTYYVQVPYTYTILTAKMVNNGLDNVINNLGLSADDLELYEYLNQTKGEKAHLF